MWDVTFRLPADVTEFNNQKIKVKDSCEVKLKVDNNDLLLLMQDISFFNHKIYEVDIKTFFDKGSDTGIYSRYRIKYREIDFDEKKANFELEYHYY